MWFKIKTIQVKGIPDIRKTQQNVLTVSGVPIRKADANNYSLFSLFCHAFLLGMAFFIARFLLKGMGFLEKKLSVISIIIEDMEASAAINDLLHQFGKYVVGRMGIPYKEKELSIICVVVDAPGDVTSSLSGKLGMLKGVSTKTITSKK